MDLIKSLSAKVEREQTKKLQELSSGSQASGSRNGIDAGFKPLHVSNGSDLSSTRTDFERLVLGKGPPAAQPGDTDPWATLGNSSSVKSPTQPQSPSFSWSSNPTCISSPQTGQTFRSVTPDYNVSSFPSLEPTPMPKSPMAQSVAALQSPSSSWHTQPQINRQHSLQGSASNPSLAGLMSMSSGSTPSQAQVSRPASNYSAFSIPPPPSAGAGQYQGGGNMNTGFRSPKPAWPTSSGPLALPNSQPPTSHAPSQKQGLDKYESLL